MWKIEPKVKKFKVSQIFKGVIYFEIVLFFGSFWLYRKLCREQSLYLFNFILFNQNFLTFYYLFNY
jgi:hypothetical protein